VSCDQPDALIVIDRTASMHNTPSGNSPPNTTSGRMTSKWGLAVAAVNAIVAPPIDTTVRFGLALFPEDPGSGCKTVEQIISGSTPSNPKCEPGEVLATPALGTGTTITGAISVDGTKLCTSTPISAGVNTASVALAATAAANHQQYIILITDGRDTCGEDPSIAVAQAAQVGILTHVVGFGVNGDGISIQALNAMACAGKTATNFMTTCTLQGTQYVPVNPGSTTPLYHDASDGAALQMALKTVTSDVCCDCMIN
jgi:hypothetical protein